MTNERAVLVTGGARGIGRAIAEHLAETGWHVIATFNTGRDEAMELRRTHGVEVRQLDMTDRQIGIAGLRSPDPDRIRRGRAGEQGRDPRKGRLRGIHVGCVG